MTHFLPSARRHAQQPYRSILLLPAFALILLLALWSAAALRLTQERRTAENDAVAHSQLLARTLADHANALLRQTDHATQLFKLQYEARGGALRLAEFARRNGLLDSVLPSRLDLPIARIDAEGGIADGINGYPRESQAGAEFFRRHAGNSTALAETLLATIALVERGEHRWLIRISRRLDDKRGHFAGVIAILVDPAYFVDDYDRLNVDDDGALLLVSRDAGLSTGRIGQTVVRSDAIDFVAPADARHPPGELAMLRPVDAVARLYSGWELPRYALLAVVGIARADALVRYERHRRVYIGALTAATLGILAFVWLLTRQSQRLRASMLAAREAQAMLRAAADGSLDSLMLLKAWPPAPPGGMRTEPIEDFVCADLNQRAADLLRRPRDTLLGQKLITLFPRLRHPRFFDKYVRVLESGQALEDEFELQRDGGETLWLHHQIVAIADGVAVTSRDITARKNDELALRASETALLESESRLRTIADTLPAMIAYIDAAQVYRFHNLAYEKEFGRYALEVGRSVREAVGDSHYATLRPFIERVLAGETLRFEEEEQGERGLRCMEVNYIPQFSEDGGEVIGFHVMRQDITMQKREKQRLLKLAQVDALTGLVNRAGFLQKLAEAMRLAKETGGMMAVMYLDIDRFKPVNDTHGHSVGDALLKAFSARLAHTMRAGDTIARLGGDEFTLIMEHVGGVEDARLRAAHIVAAMQAPFDLDGLKVGISASIGVTFYEDEDLAPAELLKQADVLLYRAKQAGRNTYRAATLAQLATLTARGDAARADSG